MNDTFFNVLHAPMITTKQLKLRDSFEDVTPMLKSVSERKKKYALCIKYSVYLYIWGMCLFIGKEVKANLN